MSITGSPGGPGFRMGVAIADVAAGMFAFQGLLLALFARVRTGQGQLVDVSLLDSVLALLTYQAGRYFATGEPPTRTGNRHTAIAPYDSFDAADGELILAVGNDDQWQRFCRALALDQLAADPRFPTNDQRVVRYDELRPLIAAAIERQPLDRVVATLRAAGVPCGAVRSIAEALGDPQAAARAMVETIDHRSIGAIRMLGLPVKLSATPGRVVSAPPRLGEHTFTVLREDVGLTAREIDALERQGIVRSIRPDEDARSGA